jgi:hypothetical protein
MSHRRVTIRPSSRSLELLPRATLCAAALLGATSCAKGPYTSRAEELKQRLSDIRATATLAASARTLGSEEKITVTPALMAGSYRKEETNTLVLDSRTLADLGKARDCNERARTGKGVDCDDVGASDHFGALCANDAAAVLERGEWGREEHYHSRELSTQCTTYLLRLRYVLLVRTTKWVGADLSSGVSTATAVEGSAVLVDLEAKKAIGAFPVRAESTAEYGGTQHNYEKNYDYRRMEKDARNVTRMAQETISAGLIKVFPGAKDVDYFNEVR